MISRETPAEKLFMALVRRWCTLEHPELLKEVVGKDFKRDGSFFCTTPYIIRRNLPVYITDDCLFPAIPDIEAPETLEDLIAMGVTLAVTLQLGGAVIDFRYGLDYRRMDDHRMKPAWVMAFCLATEWVITEANERNEKEAKDREKYYTIMAQRR